MVRWCCLSNWSIRKLPLDLLVMLMVLSIIQLVDMRLRMHLSKMKMEIGITSTTAAIW